MLGAINWLQHNLLCRYTVCSPPARPTPPNGSVAACRRLPPPAAAAVALGLLGPGCGFAAAPARLYVTVIAHLGDRTALRPRTASHPPVPAIPIGASLGAPSPAPPQLRQLRIAGWTRESELARPWTSRARPSPRLPAGPTHLSGSQVTVDRCCTAGRPCKQGHRRCGGGGSEGCRRRSLTAAPLPTECRSLPLTFARPARSTRRQPP